MIIIVIVVVAVYNPSISLSISSLFWPYASKLLARRRKNLVLMLGLPLAAAAVAVHPADPRGIALKTYPPDGARPPSPSSVSLLEEVGLKPRLKNVGSECPWCLLLVPSTFGELSICSAGTFSFSFSFGRLAIDDAVLVELLADKSSRSESRYLSPSPACFLSKVILSCLTILCRNSFRIDSSFSISFCISCLNSAENTGPLETRTS